MDSKQLILDFSHLDLIDLMNDWGASSYRGTQIWQGLYKNLWQKPGEFTTLPLLIRDKLSEHFIFSGLQPSSVLQSTDGSTRKILFSLKDGISIEAVLMKYKQRHTLCISTQAGCALGCVFCATGQMGYRRNLSRGEIVEQVLYHTRFLAIKGERISNIVFMGMGEPFLNYDATLDAIDLMKHPQGMNIGERRFTISTVGIVPMIRRFTAEKRQINLAVSLHAIDDDIRSTLLPINRKYPVNELLEACQEYVNTTGRRLTFEWALIHGVNDKREDARNLGRSLQGTLCHVNVIPLNPTKGYSGKASVRNQVNAFSEELKYMGVNCSIRVRRGVDIQAGCGQLATINMIKETN